MFLGYTVEQILALLGDCDIYYNINDIKSKSKEFKTIIDTIKKFGFNHKGQELIFINAIGKKYFIKLYAFAINRNNDVLLVFQNDKKYYNRRVLITKDINMIYYDNNYGFGFLVSPPKQLSFDFKDLNFKVDSFYPPKNKITKSSQWLSFEQQKLF